MKKNQNYLRQSPRTKVWKTAIYIRLSKEDLDKKDESVSVKNQREILLEYLRQNPELELVGIYIDDGYTGTDFDRPDFKRLKDDIENGIINCVVVKDSNRLGRNYTAVGELTENYFPRNGVRFIAVNNCYDSADDNMNDVTRCISMGVTNVINESYSAMNSVSIRGTLNSNRKNGKFIGAFACYGYAKDPDDHHKLIIDDEAADVVRMIYKRFISGSSVGAIARELNNLGIPNPTDYKQKKGLKFHSRKGKNDGLWSDRTIRRILQNEMYIGNMVQGINKVISYKIHECKAVPKEDWIVVENTHEPIVSRETFDKAQALFGKHIRSSHTTNNRSLFAGLVRCADCGAIMSKKTNKHSYGTYSYYRCTTKLKKGNCTTHSIRIDKLEDAVLKYLKTMIDLAVEYDEVVKNLNNEREKPERVTENALASQKAELEMNQKAVLDLYPDWKAGILTRDEYFAEKEYLTERINELNESINNIVRAQKEESKKEKNSFVTHFLKHKNINKLTPEILNELVDTIYVYEDNRITIRIKYVDALEELITGFKNHEDVA